MAVEIKIQSNVAPFELEPFTLQDDQMSLLPLVGAIQGSFHTSLSH